MPVLKQHKNSAIAKSLAELADHLAPAPKAASSAVLGRLFRSKARIQHSPA
jgi:pilus assembly protein CpaE